ncbi:hypothetical protein ANAPH1_00882 [Anaplasma phagocytophilum]|nr:hypothetical protein ANAPH1_00882 [Anaplasma phagocytophilum]
MLRAQMRIKKLYFLVLSDGHCHFMLAPDIDAYSKLVDTR